MNNKNVANKNDLCPSDPLSGLLLAPAEKNSVFSLPLLPLSLFSSQISEGIA